MIYLTLLHNISNRKPSSDQPFLYWEQESDSKYVVQAQDYKFLVGEILLSKSMARGGDLEF